MAKMGRPKIEIDIDLLDKYCAIMCTAEEISNLFECSTDTLNRFCNDKFDCTFAVYYKRKSALGKRSLRRWQYGAAEKGNVTMLIWLGKQYLGQSDKQSYINERDEKYKTPDSLTDDDPQTQETN